MGIGLAQYQSWEDTVAQDEAAVLDDATAWDETAGAENLINYLMNTTSAVKSYEGTATFLSNYIPLPPVRMNSAKIEWTENKPTGTSISCSVAISKDNGATWTLWKSVTNGGSIPGLSQRENLTGYKIQVRFDMSTTNLDAYPSVSQFVITINSMKIIRFMPDGAIKLDKQVTQNASETF